MDIFRRVAVLALVIIITFGSVSGCLPQDEEQLDFGAIKSYRDIPGVTQEEIEQIEKIKEQNRYFVYGMVSSTESFYDNNGKVRGFTQLFTEWLSSLFEIKFIPELVPWDGFLESYRGGEIDFTGHLMATEERQRTYHMTDPIARRSIMYYRLAGSPSIAEISESRTPRYALVKDTATAVSVTNHSADSMIPVFIDDYSQAYEVLKSGEADAFVSLNIMENLFNEYDDLVSEDFYPIIYSLASFSTANLDYGAFISVVQKLLDHGAYAHIHEFYKQGHNEYLRHYLFTQLSEEERYYIYSSHTVPFVAEHSNYPISFYSEYDGEWQGIAFDVLNEVEKLTGLKFEPVNDQSVQFYQMVDMLLNGQAHMISELIRTPEREQYFLWPDNTLLTDRSMLISKTELPHIEALNEVYSLTVGVVKNTAHADFFNRLFPYHQRVVLYDDLTNAFDALIAGEVDVVMHRGVGLLHLTHFREFPGYKANVIFDNYFFSSFGFNRDEAVLRNIVDKTLDVIDVATISQQWMHRTYDYRVQVVEGRMPWVIGAGVLVLIILILVLILHFIKRREERQLEKIVDSRTRELDKMREVAEKAVEEATARLKENEFQLAKIKLVTESAHIALWDIELFDDDPTNLHTKIHWTDDFKKMLGYADADEREFPSVLTNWSKRLHPDDKEKVLNHFDKHLLDRTGKTPYNIEYRLRCKDGGYKFFNAYGETIRRDDGSPVLFVGALMDISEMKNSLLENEMQLTRIKLMTEASGIGLWDMEIVVGDPLNPENTFIFSDTYRSIIGYTDENDFPNIFDSWIKRVHPDDIDDVMAAYEGHINDYTGNTPYDIEFRMKTKQGEYRYYRDWGDTIRGEGGVPIHSLGALMDINDTKSMLVNLEKLRREAEDANKAKSAFLSTVSHEIRTPLNAIIGITEIELNRDGLDTHSVETYNRIHGAGDMLLGIINDLLDISKAEIGQLELISDKYEIASVIVDIAQLNLMRIGSKRIEFELDVDENIPAVFIGDQLRVKQILNNILSNAFKYTESGKIKFIIGKESSLDIISGEDIKNEVLLVFTISDTGQGMTEEQVKQLFDMYTRFNLEKNRTIEGTGLGMSITRNLVNLMNGEITVESKIGIGTTFTVRLPQELPKTDKKAEVIGKEMADRLRQFRASESPRMKRVQVSREPMPYGRVLVVDDVETNIYVTTGLLIPYKLNVDSALSGTEAIEKVENGEVYDIIFMDHMMPVMDGMETTENLRKIGYEGTIVALTANAGIGQAELFISKGFDGFISKPIDIRQLNAILNKFIRDKQPEEVIKAAHEQAENEVKEDTAPASTSGIQKKTIPGMDIIKGLEKYNNDENVYIRILNSYVANIKSNIGVLETADKLKLDEKPKKGKDTAIRKYEIVVHGIKGTSNSLFASEIGEKAEKLENAAVDGDLKYIKKHNPELLSDVLKLTEEISKILSEVEDDNPKPVKDKPDPAILSDIVAGCKVFSINSVNAAIEKLAEYQYEKDNELVDWIREKIKTMKFNEIADKLSNYIK